MRTNRIRTFVATVLVATGVAAIAPMGVATAHDGADHDPVESTAELTPAQRKEVMRATERFRNVRNAERAGYIKVSECTDLPGVGGMGYHYLNPTFAGDTVIGPAKPELLVYQPGPSGDLRLGAVEYFVADADQDTTTDGDRPSLYGSYAFDGPMEGHEPGMPVHYDLHIWLYKDNPAGQLVAWNPAVSCS